jgi:hypothetical protein
LTIRKLKNNLSPAEKRASIVAITLICIIIIVAFFLIFKKKENKISEDKIPVTSLKLTILNGCGYDGAAKDVKEFLINKDVRNLDIIAWKNVERNMFIYKKTIIVVKKNDQKKLEYLMKITGINRRIYALDANTIEDMQIILGNDYKKYFK